MLYRNTPSKMPYEGVIWLLAAIVWYSAALYGGWPHNYKLGACGAGGKTAEDPAQVRRFCPPWAGVAPRQRAPPHAGRGSTNACRRATARHAAMPGGARGPGVRRGPACGRPEPGDASPKACAHLGRRAAALRPCGVPVSRARGERPARQAWGRSAALRLGGGRVRGAQECVARVGRSWRDAAGGGKPRAARPCPARRRALRHDPVGLGRSWGGRQEGAPRRRPVPGPAPNQRLHRTPGSGVWWLGTVSVAPAPVKRSVRLQRTEARRHEADARRRPCGTAPSGASSRSP